MSTRLEQMGMVETESGLAVPKSAIELKHTAWDYNDYKQLFRAQKAMQPLNATVFIMCNECGKQIHSELSPISHEHELVCDCTVRRIA